jgi:acyl transferase domain-containing protein/NADPH:quinone reductase-like Zn-dependent oxidoreductase/acyl carrier protein
LARLPETSVIFDFPRFYFMSQPSIPPLDPTKHIAIVGMQLRYPGATTKAEFWQNLCNGTESISFFDDEEMAAAGFPPELIANPNFVQANPHVGDTSEFDAAFFGFTPHEAEVMDPQIRVMLECSWQALEDAGYDAERFAGRIGVFMGANLSNYFMSNLMPQIDDLTAGQGGISALTLFNDRDSLATIVSYKLNLKGPSVTVQTYCSTSLVSVHLGCQSILGGDCEMVLAGGVSLNNEQVSGYSYEEGSIKSRDGHCRTFDAAASGTVFGNGVGVVVLKRLDRAMADGDEIHAVIRGSAINNDGAIKAGYTAPSVQGQIESISAAIARADVSPETIGFVEAHGTATLIGDPIEVTALTSAFSAAGAKERQYCALGSAKTNFGHLDRAAGVAGLMKTAMVVREGIIPPSLHYTTPNPKIDFESSPFFVNTALRPWDGGDTPRRGLVCSLGVGGTNAHAVVEAPPEREPSGESRAVQLVVLSARSGEALSAATDQLIKHLNQHPDANLADVAYTLQQGRKPFGQRRIAVGRDATEIIAALEDRQAGQSHVGDSAGATNAPVAFLFPGQGSQYVQMGRELYDTEPVYRAEVDRCAVLLESHLGLDLRTILYPTDGDDEAATEKLKQTAITQPALFVVEYALAKLWQSWGVEPEAMIGHSIGEYVAATLAGVFQLEDALGLVAARGRLMQGLPAGSMLAVPVPESELAPLLGDELSLAAVNAPGSSVASGSNEAVAALAETLKTRGVEARRLQTSHAFHSRMMDPILPEFTALVEKVARHAPTLPYVSNLTGTWITAEQAIDPAYWAQHLRGAVRFTDGVAELLGGGTRVGLEVGPGRTLSALSRQRPEIGPAGAPLTSLRHPMEKTADDVFLLATLGKLWTRGVAIDWAAFSSGEKRRRVPLPTYPFDRQSYWVQRKEVALPAPVAAGVAKPFGKQADLADWFYAPAWRPTALAPNATAGGPEWLVLADASDWRDALMSQIAAAGGRVTVVETGADFAATETGRFTVNPTNASDFIALLAALRADGRFPSQIVHGWSLQPTPGDALAAFADTQAQGFYSLLFLAQALGEENLTAAVRLGVVTTQLQSVADEQIFGPERATLMGPSKVIAQEYPEVASVAIDVAGTPADMATAVVAELGALPVEPVVAWRDGQRHVQAFEASPLAAEGPTLPLLKTGGVYLITGGLGGIGLKVAAWLARTVQARLVLTNRSALPPREEWAMWLASHDSDDRVSRRIASVQQLEAAGAEVLLVTADTADLAAMTAAVAEARTHFGRVDGVMHAAGVAGDGVIQLKEQATAAAVIDAKIKGALVLTAALGTDQPDFLVHFSSIAAVTGGFGQVDYCGANSCLDVLAQAAEHAGGPTTISINWDAWAEVGMAVETVARPKALAAQAAAPTFEAIEHPLFQRGRETADGFHYVGEFSEAGPWLITDHELYGKPTLPGTAYLELARAAFARHVECESYTFSDMFIMATFSVEPGQVRELHVMLTKVGDGFDFTIKSQAAPGSKNWLEHSRGHLEPGTTVERRTHDMEAIAARCTVEHHDVDAESKIVPGELLRQADHLRVGPRWMTPEWVKLGDREGIAAQKLADAYVGDLADHPLHPGMVDLTAFFPFKTASVYIPFSHGTVRVFGPLPQRIRSYIKQHDDLMSGKPTANFEMLICDEAGAELVVMEDYLLKKVEASSVSAAAGDGGGEERFPFLPGAENFQVNMSALGQLDTLALAATERVAPSAGEVEIQMHAAGLNFKDVLRGLGMLSSEHDAGLAQGFGGEGAGVVVGVGDGVTAFAPGDRVVVMGAKCFGGFVTVAENAAAPLAEGVSFEDAATIPLVFLTAHYALHVQGRLAKGERVLIHAAAGGVGLAAIQCALRVGAEVYATAGSPQKRDYVKSLGVEHVFDSRSLSFADDVMAATGGEGVDVVLNSLSGEFITKGLGVLRQFGRFIEIGARDIYQNSQLGLRPFANNLSFMAIELGPVMLRRPAYVREMLDEIMGYFRAGSFQPLPKEVFPITAVSEAFQTMAGARHIGKLVLSITPPARALIEPSAPSSAATGSATADSITPTEGLQALARILNAGAPQIVVSPRPLQPILDHLRGQVAQAGPTDAAEMPKPATRKRYPRPALGNAYEAPTTPLETELAEAWQSLLGIQEVGVHDNFFELGGDSLIGVQVISRIKKEFGVNLPSSLLYEGPTIAELAAAIEAARA